MAREYINREDMLNTGREKLNRSIDKSYDAEDASKQALKDANELGNKAIDDANKIGNEAKSVANSANTKSDISIEQSRETQRQLDEIVIESGTSDAEVVQSRADFPHLKDRLSNTENLANGFFRKVLGVTKKIELIGDSITEGVGATGHTVPSTNPIIFEHNGEIYKEGCYTCDCWANQFRRYIAKNYPTIEFFNKGIGGKSTRWAMQPGYKEAWLSNNADMVFVMLGMNDRSLGDFKQNITSFLKYVDENSNHMIVMIANPTLNDDPSKDVEVRKINDIIIEVCQKNNYFYISHYIDLLDYIDVTNQPLSNFVQSDGGSHPLNSGYDFIWKNNQKKLGFIDNQNDFGSSNNYAQKTISQLPLNFATSRKQISEFPIGASTCAVQSSSTGEFGLPDNAGAIVNTYRTDLSGVGYSYQEIVQYGTNITFRRTILENGNWSKYIPDYGSGSVTVTTSIGPIDSMKVGTANISLSGQSGLTLDKEKYAVVITPNSVVDTNLMFTACLDDNGRFVYIRLFNTSVSQITPGEIKIDVTYTRKPY